MSVRERLHATLKAQNNILFAKPCIVYRGAYSGRNLIAKNSEETDVDNRNYFPVERWIFSKTVAENDKPKLDEGLSMVILRSDTGSQPELISFKEAVSHAQQLLLGDYSDKWPLTKILDIGGKPVKLHLHDHEDPSDANVEVPPIPAHVHSGNIHNGKAIGPGKKEAYFFPPVNVAPYSADFGNVITRLGIKPSVTKEQFESGLQQFGKNDRLYDQLNVYSIRAYDGWTIEPGVIHAPGPWLTFEIQRPQDDFNLCCWKLGCQIRDASEREKAKQAFQMKGLDSERSFISELVKWDLSAAVNFKEKFYRPSTVIEEGTWYGILLTHKGDWGRRLQIFFDGFYGEGFEVKAGKTMVCKSDSRPYSGIVWSGSGSINSNRIDCTNDEHNEFLVVPNTDVTLEADTSADLLIYVVFPLEF